MRISILIVDDELSMREFLTILLEKEGYLADTASNADEALAKLKNKRFDMVISDVNMPGLTGIELLSKIKEITPDTVVLMITAFSTAEQAVEAMKIGAYDYIPKPFKIDEVKLLIKNALEKRDLKIENSFLRQNVEQRDSFCGILGKSIAMQQLCSMLQKIAASSSSVLVQGESGTGKELAARAIHENSTRKNKKFVAVNCAAIPETLMEAELFGHKKGSFTGAVADRGGLFEEADGGTLFLDEIGELPLGLQSKLLRVLQEKEFRRIGESIIRKTDIRLLTATNRNLEEQVKNGAFREDLYYRINVVQITMPPLRERADDIPLLVEHFFHRLGGTAGNASHITSGALKRLMNYSFPGNIRELENIVERALILDKSCISEQTLPQNLLKQLPIYSLTEDMAIPDEGLPLESLLEELEKKYLVKALEKTGGAKKKAAELLGMTFRSFRYRLEKFGLDREDD